MSEIYAESALLCMNGRRQNDKLCDFVIHVRDEAFPVHRLLLDSSSEFFRAMFDADMKEAGQRSVRLEEVDPSSVKLCLDFIYTGEANIDMSTVEGVVKVSTMWQLDEMTRICKETLRNNINVSACFTVRNISTQYGWSDLKVACEQFISRNAKGLVKDGDWHCAEKKDFFDCIKMLNSDIVEGREKRGGRHVHRVAEELEQLWVFLEKWCMSSPQCKSEFCDLLECISMERFRISYAQEKVWDNEHVTHCERCKKYVAGNILKDLLMPSCDSSCDITFGNWFFLKTLGELHEDMKYSNGVSAYITKNLQNLSQLPDFGKLSKQEILGCLRSSNLPPQFSTAVLMEVILRWISHDKEKRLAEFKEWKPCTRESTAPKSTSHHAEIRFIISHDKEKRLAEFKEWKPCTRESTAAKSASHHAEIRFCMLEFGKKFRCKPVMLRAEAELVDNFGMLADSVTFRKMEKSTLVYYVRKRSQKDFASTWNAVVAWVNHDLDQREKMLLEIIGSINFENASSSFLKDVVWTDKIVKNSTACRDMLMGHLLVKLESLETRISRIEKKLDVSLSSPSRSASVVRMNPCSLPRRVSRSIR